MSDLRPCIVHIPDGTERQRHIEDGKSIVETKVICPAEEHKGYFHRWSDRYWTIGESPMVGGHSAGQMSKTVAIVEYEDGTVHEVLLGQIQFTDRKSENVITIENEKSKEMNSYLAKLFQTVSENCFHNSGNYYLEKTGEIYKGQIYMHGNGEPLTDGNGNIVVWRK